MPKTKHITLGTLDAKIERMDKRLDTKIGAVANTVDKLAGAVAHVGEMVAQIAEDVTTLKTDMSGVKTRLDRVEMHVTGGRESDHLPHRVTELEERVDALEKKKAK